MKRLYCTKCDRDITNYYSNGSVLSILYAEQAIQTTRFLRKRIKEYINKPPEEIDFMFFELETGFKIECPNCKHSFWSNDGIKDE